MMMARFAAVALVMRAFIGSFWRNFITLVHLLAVVIVCRISILSGKNHFKLRYLLLTIVVKDDSQSLVKVGQGQWLSEA